MSLNRERALSNAALPPERQHARRAAVGAAADPDEILSTTPFGHPDYLRILGALLRKHNHAHSAKHKGVSFKTMADRQSFLVAFFRELHKNTRYRRPDPRLLAGRHIDCMVQRWLKRDLSTATIHTYLSFLRTFAGWIDKAGLVRAPQYYVGEASPQAHRHQSATTDHSWSAREIDVDAKIAEIAARDKWVGLQVELCATFGMRGKEARHLRPHEAITPRERANARDAQVFPEADTFLRLTYGTKGGRTRDVPVTTAQQRDLLARVSAAVPTGGYVGEPGRTAAQNRRRFYYVVGKCGITRAELGVVVHGLRHQRANDAFEADSGGPSPVRGAVARAPDDEVARRRAAHMLGHGRTRVTNCYLGSPSALPLSREHDTTKTPDDEQA